MPRNKDLKRLVRARMQKTGEAYTAARAQLLRRQSTGTNAGTNAARVRVAPRLAAVPTTPLVAAAPSPADYGKLAGMSDAAVKAKTGCAWANWVKALDHQGAAALSHGEIAELVRKKWKVGPWWGQMVAVGYERIRGLRARGQQRDGSFQATKSRTFAVPVATLFDAWADAAIRKRWLNGMTIRVRTANRPKSLRLERGDGSIISVAFVAKGTAKSSVAIEHTKLASREAAARVKAEWSARFDALSSALAAQ